MKNWSKKKRIVISILCGILVLASLSCFIAVGVLARLLPSQYEAERWQGDGDQAFGQVTCFLPVDSRIDLNEIYRFRYAVLDQLHEAGYEADTKTLLFRDAWSVSWKVKTSSAFGRGDATAIAVGGHFFDFHPLRLLNGSYISEDDLMQDQVLLDEELAWQLFGGTDLQGMEMRINGVPFVVAGVVEREQDFASRKAYTSGMGLFMSYDAYVQLQEEGEETGASCYELTLAEPVKNFTYNFVKEKFPVEQAEILKNSGRFTPWRLLGLIGSFGGRSMQTTGILYPYWENAARCVEDWSSMLLLIGLLCAAFPAGLAIVLLARLLACGKEELGEKLFPGLWGRLSEGVRKVQRRRWVKKHPEEK